MEEHMHQKVENKKEDGRNNGQQNLKDGKNCKKYSVVDLRRAIKKENVRKITKILQQNPHYINDYPKNPFILACLLSKKNVVLQIMSMAQFKEKKLLFHLGLIECIRYSNIQMVKTLLEVGCDPNIILLHHNIQLSTIDYAILGGHYEIAQLIYPFLSFQNAKLRKSQEYTSLSKKFKYRYVNYELFLTEFAKKQKFEQIKNIFKKEDIQKEQIEMGCLEKFLRIISFCFVGKRYGKNEISKGTVSTNEDQNPNIALPDSERNFGP